jgi:hypothetical protein
VVWILGFNVYSVTVANDGGVITQIVIVEDSVAWKVAARNLCNGLTRMVMELLTNPNVLRYENSFAMGAVIMVDYKAEIQAVVPTQGLLLHHDHNLI